MRKILEYILPDVNHVPSDNQVLSILGEKKETLDWQMSNFLHMYVNPSDLYDFFYPRYLWKICPFISVYRVPYKLVKNNFSCFTDFIKSCLEMNGYIYSLIDVSDISEYSTVGDYTHNPIIFGIDEANKTVNMADFFGGIYRSIECSFENMNSAFEHLPLCDTFNDECNNIYLLLYDTKAEYHFDLELFRFNLNKYKNGINLYKEDGTYVEHDLAQKDVNSLIFGIKLYDFIMEGNATRRNLSLLVLHSVFWKKRLKFLNQKRLINIDGNIIELADQMVKILRNSLLIFLKMQCISENNSKSNTTVLNNLNICKSIEMEIINYIMNS